MDTHHLREYLVFARELNYSTAARKLYITRPTLKGHIGELEAELCCNLIERRGIELVLTPEGRHMVQRAIELLDLADDIIDEFHNMSNNLLTVTIASTNLPWLESILYKARHRIQKQHPDKRIEVVTVNGPLCTLTALKEAHNDIVVVGHKSYLEGDARPSLPDGLQAFWLRTEEIKLLMTQDNPLFEQGVIRARDMDGRDLMVPPDIYQAYLRDGMVQRFARSGARINLQTAEFGDHFEYFNYDFKSKIGIVPTTLIPRFGIDDREECRAFSLDDLPFYTDFFAVYHEKFLDSQNGRLLIEEMKTIAAQNH
jgi:DNA-binding transcriptional LysR family regulator